MGYTVPMRPIICSRTPTRSISGAWLPNVGLGLLLAVAACKNPGPGSANPTAAAVPAKTQAAPQLAASELTVLANGSRVFKYREGGITLHSLVAPEVSEAVNSHII